MKMLKRLFFGGLFCFALTSLEACTFEIIREIEDRAENVCYSAAVSCDRLRFIREKYNDCFEQQKALFDEAYRQLIFDEAYRKLIMEVWGERQVRDVVETLISLEMYIPEYIRDCREEAIVELECNLRLRDKILEYEQELGKLTKAEKANTRIVDIKRTVQDALTLLNEQKNLTYAFRDNFMEKMDKLQEQVQLQRALLEPKAGDLRCLAECVCDHVRESSEAFVRLKAEYESRLTGRQALFNEADQQFIMQPLNEKMMLNTLNRLKVDIHADIEACNEAMRMQVTDDSTLLQLAKRSYNYAIRKLAEARIANARIAIHHTEPGIKRKVEAALTSRDEQATQANAFCNFFKRKMEGLLRHMQLVLDVLQPEQDALVAVPADQ